ncbi:unnamed protein product [Rotaria magnacalcarata]|uniref:Uncharacterized protein n=1 Tax=Rotaria magnacalcarata TaxID=392030 RepID=A0A817A068_9BILA|nr:unnamed protein product [Rotaria magnacalcarata]CAF1615653.1 unnamed protein product [Rotaria magnacalcarata]CAF2209886.1 unnamed protein product [Rotaria magnacalcarata]CAF2241468.1 unnamed protein product [Rotaria magnacalcarata]CAF3760084.1 unnamed protein product [Rotaria magnacalcarata]
MYKNAHCHEPRNTTTRAPSPVRELASNYVQWNLTEVQIKNLLLVNDPTSRSNSPAWKRPVPGSSVDFVEAVFRLENFRIFSGDFRSIPAEKHRNLTGIRRKSSIGFLTGILLPCSSVFPCFPAGYGDFTAYFLEYSTGFGGQNVRPEQLQQQLNNYRI